MYQKIATDNLQTFIIKLPKKTEVWTVRLDVAAGYMSTSEGKQEVPHLLEHYLIKCLKMVGLDCWASTDIDTISLYIDLPKKDRVKNLELFISTILNNQVNNADVFDLEKRIWKNEHLGILDKTETFGLRLAIDSLLEKQPFATEYTDLSLADIQEYYQKTLLRSKAWLFVGTDQVKDLPLADIQRSLRLFKRKGQDLPSVNTAYNSTRTIECKRDTNRTYLCLIWPALIEGSSSKEHIALTLIADLLCDPEHGLLWDSLRETNGLIYDLDYYHDPCSTFGYFSIQVAALDEDVDSCLEIIQKEINQMVSGQASLSKLSILAKQDKSACKRLWANNESRFKWIVSDIKYQSEVCSLQEWLEQYATITPEYLQSIAKKYLSNNLQVVKIGKG